MKLRASWVILLAVLVVTLVVPGLREVANVGIHLRQYYSSTRDDEPVGGATGLGGGAGRARAKSERSGGAVGGGLFLESGAPGRFGRRRPRWETPARRGLLMRRG